MATPMSDEEYYKLNRLARLRHRMRTNPRRVLDLTMICASLVLDWIGSTILAPLTPWYVAKFAPDWDEGAAASLLMASYAAGTLFSALITGPLSDRIGRRPVFIGCLTIYTLSNFLLANAWSMESFVGFRVMGGASSGTRPVVMAFLIDSSRREDMTFLGVLVSLSVCFGMAVGPVLGGLLATHSLSLPFYFVGGCAAVVLLLMVLFLREPPHSEAHRAGVDSAPHNPWFIPTLTAFCVAGFCVMYIYTSWTTILGLLGADRYGLSAAENGLVMGTLAISVVLANVVYLPLTAYFPHALLASLGFGLLTVLIVVPYIYNLAVTIVMGLIVGFGMVFYFGGMGYINAVISPAHRRGLVNSLVMALSNAGGIAGPLLGGALYDLDPEHRAYPFFVMTGVAVMGGASCFVVFFGVRFTLRISSCHCTSSQ